MNDPLLLREINKEIQDFKTKQISIVPGFTFSQYETLHKIIFYYNSKFQTGEIDAEGDRKYFLNINRNPCKVFSKAIDFDTKNIRMLTAGGGDSLKTWFMERDLKYWMRDKQFGKVLNRIFKELPIFGSVVLKIVDGTPYFVDLRNFVLEQAADDLESSNYLIEIHNYTPAEFRKVGKQMKWDKEKIDQVIKLFHEMKDTSHIRVYERYGDVKIGEEYQYKRVFYADVGVDELDNYGNIEVQHAGVELACDDFEGHPYWEFHADKVPGRWLGVGVVETLFEPQIKQNETVNLESKSAYFLALHVFQTRDPAFNRNLKGDVRNGETFNVDSEVTEVTIQDRNGAFFNEQHRKWMANRDEMTFAYDAVQGERSPAGTPLGSTQISVGQTLSYFEGIQENVAMDIKEMIYEVIIPQFEKENNQEHTLRLVGKNLDEYAQMVKNELVFKEIIRIAANTGSLPTNEEKDVISIALDEAVKQGKEKLITIPKGFYKGLKYDIDIDITGESIDTRVRSATKFALLQAITSDPTMTTDPVKKKILFGIAEDGGINPNELFEVETKQMEDLVPQVGRAGGGVSAPQMGANVPGMDMSTV
jgi:hypothetical protein